MGSVESGLYVHDVGQDGLGVLGSQGVGNVHALSCERLLELSVSDAGLDDCHSVKFVDAEDFVHSGQIYDDCAGNGRYGVSSVVGSTGADRNDGELLLVGEIYECLYLVSVLRLYDEDRSNCFGKALVASISGKVCFLVGNAVGAKDLLQFSLEFNHAITSFGMLDK